MNSFKKSFLFAAIKIAAFLFMLLPIKLDLFNSRFQTPSERDQALLNFIKDMARPWCELGGHEDQKSEFAEIVPMSAKSPGDIERLLDVLEGYLPEAEAVYDGDTITDRSERFLAAEILREKVFRFTGEELPDRL